MTEKKKQTYQSTTLALPPLKMVLGNVPEPDPNEQGVKGSKSGGDTRSVVEKLITHIKEK